MFPMNSSPEPMENVDTSTPWQKTKSAIFSPWVIFAVLFLIGGFLVLVLPVPYVVERPGPTVDVGGSLAETPVITVSGTNPDTGQSVHVDPLHREGDAAGELRMVTVSESGGPGNRLNLVDFLFAYFDEKVDIIAYDEVYAPETTSEEVSEAALAQMRSSQNAAAVVALESLGWTVPASLTIEGAVPGSGAEGKVKEGDKLVSVIDPSGVEHRVTRAAVPFDLMSTLPEGSEVVLLVERDGKTVKVPVVSSPAPAGEKGSKMGIYLSAEVDMPVEVSVSAENIGGPSAGLIFTLGIIDRMTPGDMTGGKSIAGTGTISFNGKVGGIGGIRQKMWGALRDGSDWFLAPSENCDEVFGNVPQGLRVVKVSDVEQARSAVEKIAQGAGDALPTCEAADAEEARLAHSAP